MKTIELKASVTLSNDRDASLLRGELTRKGILLVNLMSAAGSGKTTLLSRVIRDLGTRLPIGVMEADIASDVDALAIEALGAESIQVHTDGMCHMDAGMTRRSIEGLEESAALPPLLFLENVGNLICPAEFDTGAHQNVMILSVPEGDDKPLKYPLMFRTCDALVITKMDALPYFDFDLQAAMARAKALNPGIAIFPVSARTGEGMEAFEDWLMEAFEENRHA